jgi:hypothetical protein
MAAMAVMALVAPEERDSSSDAGRGRDKIRMMILGHIGSTTRPPPHK